MVKMKNIKIKASPEAECLLKFIENRIHKKKGIILLFTGEIGEGKSYAGLRLLELWYYRWFKEKFNIIHVCNNLEEAVLLVKNFNRIEEGILIEELSVHAGVRDSLTSSNKLWNAFLDICRIKQAVIVGNAPHSSFIDKHFRMMCQVWVNCEKIDFIEEIVIARPLWLQTSPHKAEPYKHKFINKNGEEITYCYFKKPSAYISEPYDTLKLGAFDEITSEIVLKLKNDRIKQLKKMGQKSLPRRELEAYELYLKGYDSTEASKEMGLKDRDTYSQYLKRAKNRLKTPEYVEYRRNQAKSGKND